MGKPEAKGCIGEEASQEHAGEAPSTRQSDELVAMQLELRKTKAALQQFRMDELETQRKLKTQLEAVKTKLNQSEVLVKKQQRLIHSMEGQMDVLKRESTEYEQQTKSMWNRLCANIEAMDGYRVDIHKVKLSRQQLTLKLNFANQRYHKEKKLHDEVRAALQTLQQHLEQETARRMDSCLRIEAQANEINRLRVKLARLQVESNKKGNLLEHEQVRCNNRELQTQTLLKAFHSKKREIELASQEILKIKAESAVIDTMKRCSLKTEEELSRLTASYLELREKLSRTKDAARKHKTRATDAMQKLHTELRTSVAREAALTCARRQVESADLRVREMKTHAASVEQDLEVALDAIELLRSTPREAGFKEMPASLQSRCFSRPKHQAVQTVATKQELRRNACRQILQRVFAVEEATRVNLSCLVCLRLVEDGVACIDRGHVICRKCQTRSCCPVCIQEKATTRRVGFVDLPFVSQLTSRHRYRISQLLELQNAIR